MEPPSPYFIESEEEDSFPDTLDVQTSDVQEIISTYNSLSDFQKEVFIDTLGDALFVHLFQGPRIDDIPEYWNAIEEALALMDVPSPRLVGIELNPGPKSNPLKQFKGDQISAAIAAAAAVAGAAAAEKKKKKTKINTVVVSRPGLRRTTRLSHPMGSVNMPQHFDEYIKAPVQIARVSTNRSMKHTPFVVTGRSVGGSMTAAITTGQAHFHNIADTACSCNVVNIDPEGSSSDAYNFAMFPSLVRNLAANFTRYRIRKLVLEYVPTQATSDAHSIIVSVCPEVVTANQYLSSATVSAYQASRTGPSWAPFRFDLMQPGGLRREWLYVDSTTVTDQNSLRFETAGSLTFAYYGAAPTVETAFGVMIFDFEIEYDGFAPENALTATRRLNSVAKPLPSTQQPTLPDIEDCHITAPPPSSSSSSTSSPPKDTYYYVPRFQQH